MSIVSHDQILPGNFVHRSEVVNGFAKRFERFVLIQIADMLTHQRLAVHNQRDGVFQVGAGGKNRLRDGDRGHRGGRIAARTPQNHGAESIRRGRWNRPRGARWAARRSGTRRQFRRDAPSLLHPDTKSARWTGSRWSSPELRARPRQRAGDAEVYRAASPRDRRFPETHGRVALWREQERWAAPPKSSAIPPRPRVPQAREQSRCFRTISANGFSLRNFRSRKDFTAVGFRASHAR